MGALSTAGRAIKSRVGIAGGLAGMSIATVIIGFTVGSIYSYVTYHIGEKLLAMVGLAIWS